MAVVGEAHIIVRAITDKVGDDIKRGFRNGGTTARQAGESAGDAFKRGFSNSAFADKSVFTRFANGLKTARPEAEKTAQRFDALTRASYLIGPALTAAGGSISALGGGLLALGGAIGGAAIPAIGGLISTLFSLKLAAGVAKLALSGIGAAVSNAINSSAQSAKQAKQAQQAIDDAIQAKVRMLVVQNKAVKAATERVTAAQIAYNRAVREGAKELRDLQFDSRDAALNEKRAAIELEKARDTLARMADLPPNSRARKEAELAYAEAQLNLDRAKAKTSDVAAEQARIANQGGLTDGVISAMQEQVDAENALKDAQDARTQAIEDANKAIERAKQSMKDMTAMADPFKNLTESQKEFAKYLISIKPKLDELKEVAAKSFLPVLETQIDRIIKNGFPTLKTGIREVAEALARASVTLTDAFLDPKNLENLGKMFSGVATNIDLTAPIVGNLHGIFLSLFNMMQPATEKFLGSLGKVTGQWDDWLKGTKTNKDLTQFFLDAEGELSILGDIIKNVFGGLGAIIQANVGPGTGGDKILKWLDGVTKGFNDMDSSEGKLNSLKSTFSGLADNFIALADALGAFLKPIGQLGADPNIKALFDQLKVEGAPIFADIVKSLPSVLPILGDLAINFLKMIRAFTDSKAPSIFLGTLNDIFTVMTDFMQSPVGAKVIEILSGFHAITLTIGTIGKLGGVGFDLLVGKIIQGSGKIGKVLDGLKGGFDFLFTKNKVGGQTGLMDLFDTIYLKGLYAKDALVKVGGFFARIGTTLLSALMPALITAGEAIMTFFAAITPVGWIIIAVAAITAFFAWFFTQTDVGKKMWADMSKFFIDAWNNFISWFGTAIGAVGQFFTDVWNGIVAFFKPVIDGIVAVFTVGFDIMRGIIQVLLAIFTIIFLAIANVVQAVWDGIVAAFKAVSDFLKPIVDAIFKFFSDTFTNIGKFVGSIWEGIKTAFDKVWSLLKPIVDGVFTFFSGVFKKIGEFVGGVWQGFQDNFNKFLLFIKPAVDGIFGFFKTVFDKITGFIKGIINGWIDLVQGFVNGFIDGLNGVIGMINKIQMPIPEFLRGMFGGQKSIGFHIEPVGKVKIPKLAEGGIAKPSPGGTIAQIAEAGRPERVEPLDPTGLSKRDREMIKVLSGNNGQGGGDVNIHVYPSAGMDERELAAMVSRQLALQMRKGAIR